MNDGYSRLARTLDGRTRAVTARPDDAEFGEIQPDMALKCDRFAVPIPSGQYMKCRSTGDLQPGDRVLVMWVNDSTTPVIIDVLEVD